jgi:hypothetical protein
MGTMRCLIPAAMATAMLFSAGAAVADAKSPLAANPKAADDIKRGVEDGLHCALQYLGPTQISNCVYTLARINAKDESDTRAYDLGLSFECWRDLDVDWASDLKLPKGQVAAAQLRDEETGTKVMYFHYRTARAAMGISDGQLLALMTKMTVKGKEAAYSRLQFWAARAH